MKVVLWACMSLEDGEWNIVGIAMPGVGLMPLVSSKRDVVLAGMKVMDEDVKKRAKLFKLEQVETDGDK